MIDDEASNSVVWKCIELLSRLQERVPDSTLVRLLSPFLDGAAETTEIGESRLQEMWRGLWERYREGLPMPTDVSPETQQIIFTKCLEEMEKQLAQARALSKFLVGMS
jgi:hypothetical protein